MNAITVAQPWATLIARGEKTIENRLWAPPENLHGRTVAVHAARSYDHFDAYLVQRRYGVKVHEDECPLGAVVAIATLTDVVEESNDPWFVGPYGLVFGNVVRIDPVPCRGERGIWVLSEGVELAVQRALRSSLARRGQQSQLV